MTSVSFAYARAKIFCFVSSIVKMLSGLKQKAKTHDLEWGDSYQIQLDWLCCEMPIPLPLARQSKVAKEALWSGLAVDRKEKGQTVHA